MTPRIIHRLTLALLILILNACAFGSASPTGGTPAAPDDGILSLPELTPAPRSNSEPLRVVATTSIIGDVVRNVAGSSVELTVLLANGQDPHSYQPTATDLTRVSNAHVIFVNGWNLEEGLVSALEGAAQSGVIIPISAGITPLEYGAHDEDEAHGEDDAHHHPVDPHVWFDTRHVAQWARNAATVLSALDPARAADYESNLLAYEAQLADLDVAIRAQLAAIPADNRRLVTNHDTLHYFAAAYDFEIIGTILPGVSTGTEPSAADLTALIQTVQDTRVKAIFIENVAGAGLADVLTEETGVEIYTLYTDALGAEGTAASSYIKMMQANADVLVEALAP